MEPPGCTYLLLANQSADRLSRIRSEVAGCEALTNLPVCKPSEHPGVLWPVTPPQFALGHVQGFHLWLCTTWTKNKNSGGDFVHCAPG